MNQQKNQSGYTLLVRPYTEADFAQLIAIQQECFPPPYPAEQLWSPTQLRSHLKYFPSGSLCVEATASDGKKTLVGSSTTLIIKWNPSDPIHSWAETTADGFISTHLSSGNSLYGVDIAVRPSWRGRGIARLMYEKRFNMVRSKGLDRFMAGGRIPHFHKYKSKMTAEQYVGAVVAGEITDPVVTPQLRSGLRFIGVAKNYLPDEESADCAAMLAWDNPDN